MVTVPDRPAVPSPEEEGRDREDRIERAVAAFQEGVDREESFRVLVEAYLPVVEGFLRRRVARPEDRRDLAQEVFLRVYQGLDGFRGDSSFGTWLYRITHNTCSLWRRRRHARPERSLQELVPAQRRDDPAAEPEVPDPDQAPPLEVALDEEQRRLLREAIDRLPEQMRRAMVLRVVHGLKYREVAAAMRISIETVKAHLHQARQRVGRELESRFADVDF